MKKMKIFFVSLSLITASFAFSACGGNAAADTEGKEYTAAYVCPMHCTGSGSDKMGTCPVCKMDYVERKEHEKNGHQHN